MDELFYASLGYLIYFAPVWLVTTIYCGIRYKMWVWNLADLGFLLIMPIWTVYQDVANVCYTLSDFFIQITLTCVCSSIFLLIRTYLQLRGMKKEYFIPTLTTLTTGFFVWMLILGLSGISDRIKGEDFVSTPLLFIIYGIICTLTTKPLWKNPVYQKYLPSIIAFLTILFLMPVFGTFFSGIPE